MRIRAPEGYAVGSITVRHGLYIDGLKLTFQRIKGNALDTNDTAGSDWIGNSKGGHLEKTIGGNGAPIVGIFGNKDDRRVLALGVYQLPAPVIAWPRAVAKPQEDRPVIENRQAEPEKIAAPAEKTPTDEVPIERAGGVVNPGVPNKEPKAVPKAEGQDQPVGLLFGIFACLSVALVIGCWLAFAGKTVRPSYPFSEPGGAVSIKAAAPAPPLCAWTMRRPRCRQSPRRHRHIFMLGPCIRSSAIDFIGFMCCLRCCCFWMPARRRTISTKTASAPPAHLPGAFWARCSAAPLAPLSTAHAGTPAPSGSICSTRPTRQN